MTICVHAQLYSDGVLWNTISYSPSFNTAYKRTNQIADSDALGRCLIQDYQDRDNAVLGIAETSNDWKGNDKNLCI